MRTCTTAYRSRLARDIVTLIIALLPAPPALSQTVESLVMPGQLTESHGKFEMECKKCHTPFRKAEQNRLCLDCHKPVATDILNKAGYHGRSPAMQGKDCRACHTDHKGRAARIADFDHRRFDHAQADFALANAHTKLECDACHRAGARFREAPSACIACHRKDDKHKGELGEKCHECHNDSTWKDARFDHAKTRFALTGKHHEAKCEACHANNRFKDTPRACIACHRKEDAHKGRYGDKCESCHSAADWKSQFNHARQTRYPLLGKHATAKCDTCHRAPLYSEKLPTKCVACHKTDDVHKGRLGDKCETCHREQGWKSTTFDHDRDTRFPLANKHKAEKCQSCHRGPPAEKLATTCVSCHRSDDVHKGRFGKECERCHGDAGWKPALFDHARSTRYVLRDAHAKLKCDACHSGTLYVKDGAKALATDCHSCHRGDDVHKGQLGANCAACHTEKLWTGVKYDHNRSKFPLTGAHFRLECKACHKSPQYKDAPSECSKCHVREDVHKRTLGARCETCHTTRSWKTWDFDHNRRTRYPLDGAHLRVTCISCHRQAVSDAKAAIAPVSSNCFACHSGDDTHSGGFGVVCERCHITRDWKTLSSGAARGR